MQDFASPAEVGANPTTDLGDDTGQGTMPTIPPGVVVNVYDPTRPGLGDNTLPTTAAFVVINIHRYAAGLG